MRKLHVTWTGMSPLLMHSCATVNPLHHVSVQLAKINAKRKNKTLEDLMALSDLEFEGSLYWSNELQCPYIPSECVMASIPDAAKSIRRGSDIVKFCHICEAHIPLDYGQNLTLAQLKKSEEHRHVAPVKVQKARVMRTRPRFAKWRIEFDIWYQENMIDPEIIAQAMDYAGKFVGLCDYRPRYGQFSVIAEEVE